MNFAGCPSHMKYLFMNNDKGNSAVKLQKDKKFDMMVPCRTLESIFDDAGLTWIDFFSLDVERAEAVVLSTMNFKKVGVGVLLVENFGSDPEVQNILTAAGMIKLRTDGDGIAPCHEAAKWKKRYTTCNIVLFSLKSVPYLILQCSVSPSLRYLRPSFLAR